MLIPVPKQGRGHGALGDLGRERGVAPQGDDGAGIERGAEGGGQAGDELGGEVDVELAAHDAAPEHGPQSHGLVDQGLGDVGPALYGLVRVDLDLGGYGGPLADYDVVAEGAALQEAGPRLHVGVAADEGVYELGALAYVGALGDHAALHRGARADDDVVGDDGVGADLRALVHPDVLPYYDGPFELVVVYLRPAAHVDVLPEARARGPDAP